MYGSASAGFSLKNSDIDLVLLTDSNNVTLQNVFYKLGLQQWCIESKYIQAQVPIITAKLNLHYLPQARKSLSSKQLKRIEG